MDAGKDIAPSCLVAAIVAVSVFFVKYIPVSHWVILPLQMVMGAVVFMVLCQLTRNPEYIEMKTMLAPYLRKVNGETAWKKNNINGWSAQGVSLSTKHHISRMP